MPYLPLNYARIAALAALLTACTDRTETGEDTSGTDASTTHAPGTDTTPTTGDTSTGGQPAEPFGFVCISLSRGEGSDDDPFAGTRKVKVTLDYEPCLIAYYTEKHPEMRQDGTDGAQVFTDWQSRLCSEDVPGRAECEVESIDQTITDATKTYNSVVTYTVAADAVLDGRKLLWGPGPRPDFAECEAGLEPRVKLGGLSAVVGLDENDAALWQIQSFGDAYAPIGLSGLGCLQVNIASAAP